MAEFDFSSLNTDNIDFDDLANADIDLHNETKPLTPNQRRVLYRTASKRVQKRILKRESLVKALERLPDAGETCHIIGEGTYDFWTWIPVIQSILQTPITLYASTWTMSRPNVVELFDLFDTGLLSQVNVLTGLYFKQRESSVFSTLLTGLRKREQRYGAFKNHTKITLINANDIYLTIEGSANFTSNPRAEQYVLTNDKPTHDFFREWFDEMLDQYSLISEDD